MSNQTKSFLKELAVNIAVGVAIGAVFGLALKAQKEQ